MIEPFGGNCYVRGPFAVAEGTGAAPIPVTLPHDALRDAERSADVPGRGAGAYYPAGAYSYLKSLVAPAAWTDRSVVLEVQGAFRHGQVFVNDELAGNRADGYARFLVDLTPYLRIGGANELRIEVRCGQDSRWYSGCGLHRPVLLHVNQPVHVVPDGVKITTLDLEPDLAVIEVATTITNQRMITEPIRLESMISDADGSVVATDDTPVTLAPRETVTIRRRLYLPEPRPWGPDDPHRYAARTTLRRPGEDREDPVNTTFGVRKLQLDPKHGLRINGEPVLLRGALPAPRQRPARCRGYRPGRGASDRAAQSRRLQRDPASRGDRTRPASPPRRGCGPPGSRPRTTMRWTSRSGGPPIWSP